MGNQFFLKLFTRCIPSGMKDTGITVAIPPWAYQVVESESELLVRTFISLSFASLIAVERPAIPLPIIMQSQYLWIFRKDEGFIKYLFNMVYFIAIILSIAALAFSMISGGHFTSYTSSSSDQSIFSRFISFIFGHMALLDAG